MKNNDGQKKADPVTFGEFAEDATIYSYLTGLSAYIADHTLPGLTPEEAEDFGSCLARIMKSYNDKYGAEGVEIDEGEDIPLF